MAALPAVAITFFGINIMDKNHSVSVAFHGLKKLVKYQILKMSFNPQMRKSFKKRCINPSIERNLTVE